MSTNYTSISDPELEKAARESLRKKHPTLTDEDIENLWGTEAQRILDEQLGTDSASADR